MATAAEDLPFDPVSRDPRFVKLETEWRLLLDRHLRHRESDDAFYRYNRPLADGDPPQGWKLHVSATLLSACEIFSAIAPVLLQSGARVKALESMLTVKRLNCGSYYGYQQIGKFVTVFARSEAEAVTLAEGLHRATRGMIGPRVPSDLPYAPDGIVFYRYGAFRPLRPGSKRCDAVHGPDGELVPDLRDPKRPVPEWVNSPFAAVSENAEQAPIAFGIVPYQAISLRGKGAVYRALDLRQSPARVVILKEGIRWGEVDLDRRDGLSRLADELAAIEALSDAGVEVPEILARFRSQDRLYAAFEHIDGEPLQALLTASQTPLDLDFALGVCRQTAQYLHRMHRSGWVWRDCKPQNLIITDDGRVRPVDFEDAIRVDAPVRLPTGTAAYLPPEWPALGDPIAQDLYALGVTLHQTLSRSVGHSVAASVECYRDDVPHRIRSLIAQLLSSDPSARPSAQSVSNALESSDMKVKADEIIKQTLYELD